MNYRVVWSLFLLPLALWAAAASAPVSAADGTWPDGLRPPLDQILDAAGPADLVPVSIVLTERANVSDLRRAAAGLTGDARRRAVTDRLKSERGRFPGTDSSASAEGANERAGGSDPTSLDRKT